MGDSSYQDGDFICETENKTLWLTMREALFIDDSLSMLVEKDFGDDGYSAIRPLAHNAGIPAPIDLLEKIGMAVLFTTDENNKGKLASIQVSDTDLYMLREIATSYIKIGTEPVGFNLKRKIYALLLQSKYKRDQIARNLLSQVKTDE